jgi:peptide/nickel transport system substrate-binding protein
MRTRRAVALGMVALGALALGAGSAMAVEGNIVVDGEDQQPEGLNALNLGGATVVTNRVTCPVQCENLLGLTAGFKYFPVLAETVPSVSNGGVKSSPRFTVTFKIKANAAWSDKTPVTSEDVKFTHATYIDPKFQAASRTGWDQILRVDTPDPKTAVVVFKAPYAPWRDLFSPSGGVRLLPSHILKGKDFNTFWNGADPKVVIGTGPFVFQSFKQDESAILVPNPNYWKGVKPQIERIVFSFLKSTQGQDVAYQNGEINLFNTPAFALVPQLKKFPNTTVQNPPGVTWEHLQFNNEDPIMKDVNVRKAVAYAVDPGELIRLSAANQVFPLDSFLVPQQKPYFKASWAGVNRNLGKVAQFMKAAGYAKNSRGRYAKGGKELTINFVTISGNATRESNFKRMKKQLESAGIGFSGKFDDNFFDANGSLNTGKFQVAELAFSASSDPTSTTLFRSNYIPTPKSPAGQNTYRYSNKALDKLLDDSDKAIAVGTRASLMKRIQDHLATNMVMLPLYQRPEVTVHPNNLNGVIVNPTQVGYLDLTETWFFTGGKTVR